MEFAQFVICEFCLKRFERKSNKGRNGPARFCSKKCSDNSYNSKRYERQKGNYAFRDCIDCGNTAERVGGPALCFLCRLNRRKAKKRKERIRARAPGAIQENYTLIEIAARDRNICYLCKHLVNIDLDNKSLWGPTIDHIIPLNKGGHDIRINVKLTHRWCNSKKGTKSLADFRREFKWIT